MPSQIFRNTLFATLAAVTLTLGGCSVKEDRSECPCLLSLRPGERFDPSGSSALWLRDGESVNDFLLFGRFGPESVKEYPVDRGTDAALLWCNLTSKTFVTRDGMELLVNGSDCDSLYFGGVAGDMDTDYFTSEVEMHRMYAGLDIEVTGFNLLDAPRSIRVVGGTRGYKADKSLIRGETSFEAVPAAPPLIRKAPGEDYSVHFKLNILRQDPLSDLSLTVDTASGRAGTFPIGSMIAEMYDTADEYSFFKDYDITVDLMHGTVSIMIRQWEKEMTFETEF